tara:strand:- start:1889 stop:2413 length:525 start_codon:yes stop_codon:yes gene_type:complete
MKPSLKGFILSISIIIPLFISFFLHFFGKNNYEVPIFHKENTGDNFLCSSKVEFPFYAKSDSILEIGKNFILIDIRLDDENQNFINNEIERLLNNNFIIDVYSIASIQLDNDWKTSLINKPELIKYVSCKFLYDINFSSLILIDKFGRIRGYYQSNSEDEFERLSAEIKILMSI